MKKLVFANLKCSISSVANNLNISRNTASKYLHSLSKIGILIEEKVGKEIIYKNSYLYDLIKTW